MTTTRITSERLAHWLGAEPDVVADYCARLLDDLDAAFGMPYPLDALVGNAITQIRERNDLHHALYDLTSVGVALVTEAIEAYRIESDDDGIRLYPRTPPVMSEAEQIAALKARVAHLEAEPIRCRASSQHDRIPAREWELGRDGKWRDRYGYVLMTHELVEIVPLGRGVAE
jgi:hypothetical protein